MARGYFLQNSFLGGEWSPLSQGASDQRTYYAGMNLCLNYLPTDEGACARRSGLRFSAHARDDSGDIRLVTFLTDDGDSYVVEMTAGFLRFHQLGGLATNNNIAVLSISTATPAVVTTDGAHGYSTGNTVVFDDLDPLTGPKLYNRQYRITVLSSTTFSIAHTGPMGSGSVDGADLNLVVLGGLTVERVTETATPYTAAQLAAIKHTEEENFLYLFHPEHEPRQLSGEDLTLATMTFIDGPYLELNETATTLTPSGTSGSVTLTASSITGINDGAGFQTTDVDRLIRIQDSAGLWTWGRITARASTTSVTFLILGDALTNTNARTTWRLGYYSDTTGWPSVGVVHEQRLWLDGPIKGRVDASRSPDTASRLFDFTPTDEDGDVADDHAISRTFSGRGRKTIQWFQETEDALLVGTDGGEWPIMASALNDPLTPFTTQTRRATQFGASSSLPVKAGRNTLFIQSLGRALMEYRNEGGRWDGNDLARRARHLTPVGMKELAYAQVPVPIVWVLRNDGRLIATSYRDDLEGQQNAWHRHNVAWDADAFGKTLDAYGLVDDTALTGDGPAYAITTAPFSDPEGTRNDVLWVAVLRNSTVCVEFLTPVFDDTFKPNEAFFVDSGNVYYHEDLGITWKLTSTTPGFQVYTFYGLDRLNGDTVDLTFRAADQGTGVVAGGAVSMSVANALDVTSSAYETVTDTTYNEGALVFNSGFLSTITGGIGGGGNAVASPVAQSAFLIGEDGIRYATDELQDDINLFNVDTGAAGPVKTGTDVFTEVQAATTGNEPGGAWSGTGAVGAAVIVPNTPYVLYFGVAATGVTTDRYVAYYKVTSASTLQLMGVYATGDGGLDVQFSPAQNNQALSAMGHFFSNPTSGANNNYQYRFPIAVAYHGEDRSSLIAVPSINNVLASTPIVQNGSGLWRAREEPFSGISDMANIMGLDGLVTNTSKGFMLPVGADLARTRFFMMFHPDDIDAHIAGTATPLCPFLAGYAPSYPGGLISSVGMYGATDAAMTLVNAEAVSNSRFLGVTFPFPDWGQEFDGSAGDTSDNFYGNASVFPVDASDPSEPWYVFFPRFYANDPDVLGVRIYRYDPKTVTFTHIGFESGQMFDFVGDSVSAAFVPKNASLYWDRDTGEITAIMWSGENSETNTVVATFGTFEVEAGDGGAVDPRHIDAVIGLNYHSRGQVLRPDLGVGAQNGAALGKTRRVDQRSVLFYRTGEIQFGVNFSDMRVSPLPEPPVPPTDVFGRRPLYSGVSHRALQSSYDFDNMVAWEQTRPLPGTLVALAGFSSASDR